MEQIESLIASDQLDQAREQLEALSATQAARPAAARLRALLAAREGRFREAASELAALLAQTPDDALALLLQARVQHRLGQTDAARARCDEAMLLDPTLVGAYFSPGDLALLPAELPALLQRQREALASDADAELPRLALAGTELRLGRAEAALESLAPLIGADSSNAAALLLAAAAALALGQTETALERLQRIGTAAAGSALAPALLRVRVLLRAGRLREADELCGELLTQQADLAPLWTLRAEIRLLGGQWQAAVAAADEVNRLQPQHGRAARLRATALQRMGETAAAEAALEQHLASRPLDGMAWRQWLAMLVQRQAWRDAVARARDWSTADPEEPDAQADLAALLEHEGDVDGAMQSARSALRLKPDHVNALLIAGRAELRIGRPGPVLAKLDRLAPNTLEPGQREARLVLLARAADARNEHELAVTRWIERHRDSLLLNTMAPLPHARIMPKPPVGDPLPLLPERFAILVGLPGSGVQHLAASLRQHPGVAILADRFLPNGRVDGFSQPDWRNLAAGLSEGQALMLQRRWRKALQRSGALPSRRLLIDWMPYIDYLQYQALSSALPGASVILLERDLHDTLLDWLAFPGQHRLRAESLQAAATWLGHAASHYQRIAEEPRGTLLRVRFEDLLASPEETLAGLTQALGLDPVRLAFSPEKSLGDLSGYFPPGHAAQYRDALDGAFRQLRDTLAGNHLAAKAPA